MSSHDEPTMPTPDSMKSTVEVGEYLTLDEWGERYRLNTDPLPLRSRELNPVKVVAEVREFMEGLSETKAMVPWKSISRAIDHDTNGSESVFRTLEAAGIWRVPGTSQMSGGARFVPPQYRHRHSVYADRVEEEDHEAVMKRFARYGTHTAVDLAPRFGAKNSRDVRRIASQNGLDWKQLRSEGLHRLHRTVYTLDVWGVDRGLIAEAFGRDRSTIDSWVQFARDSGFYAPKDPSWESESRHLDRGIHPGNDRLEEDG